MALNLNITQLQKAIDVLRRGGVVIYPTETSYGIGCDATNQEAIERLFAVKERPRHKGFTVLIPEIDDAQKYIVMSKQARKLAQEHWPGPLNIIGDVVPDSPISKDCTVNGTQSVRVSSDPFAHTLTQKFGGPIVSSSANISGKDAIYHMQEVLDEFKHHSDELHYIVRAGDLPLLPASTTIRVNDNGEVQVIRQGSIQIKE